MGDLQSKIKLEYVRNQIIEGFVASEKQRISKDMSRLKRSREGLIAEQEMISNELAATEEKIASLNKKLELIKSKGMNDILGQQKDIEQSEASLAEEEIRLLKESADVDAQMADVNSTPSSEELQSIGHLSNQLDALKVLIQKEKTEFVQARLKLSEKKAQVVKKGPG